MKIIIKEELDMIIILSWIYICIGKKKKKTNICESVFVVI